VEELDPFLEEQIRAMGIEVVEHETEMNMFELNPDRVQALRHEILGDVPAPKTPEAPVESLPTRPPVLCAGCGHRSVFYMLNKLGATVTGDIGCYTLGAFPPLNAMDTTICMGASIGNAAGMKKAGFKGRICAILGDSTFFHSGITGLLDVVYNKGNSTLIVVDNRITAMTGHQEHPGTGTTLMGEPTKSASIEAIARACGMERIRVCNPYNQAETIAIIKEELEADEPSLIISRAPCPLHVRKPMGPARVIDDERCVNCKLCLRCGCPAIEVGANGRPSINPTACNGCGLCDQLCKLGCIAPSK
jgi:indolepyruvate ferredoxin oxidoreductase alpha subunit